MKKLGIFIILFAVSFLAVAKEKSSYKATIQENFKADRYNRQLGYQLVDSGNTVIFVFSPDLYKIKKPLRVFVQGSFNNWSKKNSSWELEKIRDSLWTLSVPFEDVNVLGNSGFPEFNFYVIGEVEYIETVCGKELTRFRKENFDLTAVSKIKGFQFADKNLILRPEDNALEIVKISSQNAKAKKLKEYNLESSSDVENLTNIRLVPNTSFLYRGYHPYKISNKSLDTEEKRLVFVNKKIRDAGIKSIITLSGDESLDPKKEQLSVYLTDIRRSGNQYFADSSYSLVYNQTGSEEFYTLIQGIVRFVNSHEGPLYIHSRLGIDRTGVVCAVLASFCGADWNAILQDYLKSNEMNIKEFRSERLLRRAFENLLEKPFSEIENLGEEVTNAFVLGKYLSKNEIEEFVNNVK